MTDEQPSWKPIRERATAARLALGVVTFIVDARQEKTPISMYDDRRGLPVAWAVEASLWTGFRYGEGDEVASVKVVHPDRDEAEARAQAMVEALLERVR